ncbi:Pfs domain-containing protein [Fusarium austroafricanum]|uniref:Pfs domain-containing protein n=1 Tax=Fusarium austroafricanum TaxID=2364996 RepID=A0A8H4JYT9_9HYPO|nr:Pfs domain-containing protein [Fusarium austroafricanum]
MAGKASSLSTHYAILIGINAYPDKPLKGCVRDVQHIESLLEKQLFPIATQVFTATANAEGGLIEDRKFWPTYNNVTAALRDIVLRAQPGGYVYIHYSGHGTRLSPESKYSNTHTGDLALALLGDDGCSVRPLGGHKLAIALNALVAKGLVVTVVLDCCFAASIYRLDRSNVRCIRVSPEVTDAYYADSKLALQENAPGSDYRDVSMQPSWLMDPNGYAMLVACDPHKEATEIIKNGVDHGALSHFLCLSLRDSGFNTRHKDIFSSLCAAFKSHVHDQCPLLYGNKDQGFFGKAGRSALRSMVPVVRSGQELILQAGEIHGVSDGDELMLYPSSLSENKDTLPIDIIIAKVKVANPLTSFLHLDDGITSLSQDNWAATPQTRKALRRYSVLVDEGFPHLDELFTAFEKHCLSIYSDQDKQPSSFSVILLEDEYKILGNKKQDLVNLPTLKRDSTDAEDIATIVEHLMRYQLVKDLANNSSAMTIQSSLDINVTTLSGDTFGPGCVINVEQDAGTTHMFTLTLKNNSTKACYLYIFDLGPLWKIENVIRGSYEVVPPSNPREGFTGQYTKKFRTMVPPEMREKGVEQCDDILKVLVTSHPISLDLLELPKIGDSSGRKPQKEVDRSGSGISEEWTAFDFPIRTSVARKIGIDKEGKLGDQAADTAFEEPDNEDFNDTAATIYSEASSTTSRLRTDFISEFADQLVMLTESFVLNQEIQERVSGMLPELLRAFALKIGHWFSSKEHREIMVLVHRGRHQIAQAFEHKRFSKSEDMTLEASVDSGDTHSRTRKWLESQGEPGSGSSDLAHCATMPESSGAYPEPFGQPDEPEELEEMDELEEVDGSEDVTDSRLRRYRELIVEAPAFKWLRARLQNKLGLASMEPRSWERIGNMIWSALPSSSRISKSMPSQRCRALIVLDWDLFEFFRYQGYARLPHEVFEDIITLTGSSIDAQATTCAEYLRQNWPSTVEDIVALMKAVLEGRHSGSRWFSDGTYIKISVRNFSLVAEVNGVAPTIVDIGEQLAWLGSALRTSQVQDRVVCCTPEIVSIEQEDSPLSGIVCKIGFSTEKSHAPLSANGQCWQAVFNNPVIVDGYPMPQRSEWHTGLEVPLHIMAGLARALQIQKFNDKVCLKGFSTMLVPIRRSGNILFWHLLYKKDGTRISYLDNDLEQEQEGLTLDILQNSRHVLGWCSKAKVIIGKYPFILFDIPAANERCVADPSVRHSMLGKPGEHGALNRRVASRGKTVSGAAAVLLGVRESPQIFSNGYVSRLQYLKARFVLLWDRKDKRGWLVSGTVALLLALRAFLVGPYKSSITCKSEDFCESGEPLTAMSAFEILQNDRNQNLLLYSDRTPLRSKIEDLCNLFEQFIDHQNQITTGANGGQLGKTARGDLEGWEFEDLAGMDQDPLHPRLAKIETHGKGWVDFTRAIRAVTLFGCGFGEVIQPDVETCDKWAKLPIGQYYIAACVSDLWVVFKEHGIPEDGYIRLGEKLAWWTPTRSEFCQCPPKLDQDDCEPVQTVLPLHLSPSSSSSRRKEGFPESGALIFGHSSQFPWVWEDSGIPIAGHVREPVLSSPRESGLGSSETPSQSERQYSDFSRSDTRSTEFPSGPCDKPLAPPAPGTAFLTYSSDLYNVGILCALPKELKAVRALFDETHGDADQILSDRYAFGKLGHHMVVATCLSCYGTNAAAAAAGELKSKFHLRFCLLVGIGGGAPSKDNDIRLGDVVVGTDVIQYDLGNRTVGGFIMKKEQLHSPPDLLVDAISNKLKADPNPPSNQLGRYLRKFRRCKQLKSYRDQGAENDILFQACSKCQSLKEVCPDRNQHVPLQRLQRPTREPKVHYGKIASGNQVIKDARFRDEQAEKLKIMCFEMEAAGVVNFIPCLVIRGICDYCDDHKNDKWQEYAAATAAAYAKLLLSVVREENTDDDAHHPRDARNASVGLKRQLSQLTEKLDDKKRLEKGSRI